MNLNKASKYIHLTLNGDTSAFSELYKSTNKRIYFICMSFLKNEHDADDAIQETYLTAYKNLYQLTDPKKFNRWLEQIAINKCRDFLKKNESIPVDNEELEEKLFEEKEIILPEEYIMNNEKRKIIMNIIQKQLSDLQYQTVILYYFNNLTCKKISEIMRCSEGAVKNRLSVARVKIKSGVEQYEIDNNDKLYSFTGVPSIALLLSEEAKNIIVPDLDSLIMNKIIKISASENSLIADSSIKIIRKIGANMIKGKSIAVVISAIIAVSGITTTVAYLNDSKLEDNNSILLSDNMKTEHTEHKQTEENSINIEKEKTTSTIVVTTKITTETSKITKNTETTINNFNDFVYDTISEINTYETEDNTLTDNNTSTTIITETTTNEDIDLSKYENLLLQLNYYQEQFFELRKLKEETYDYETYNDKNLFTEIETKISQDNLYYEQYNQIEPNLYESNFGYDNLPDIPDNYYVGAVVQWDKIYTEYDALLNDLYNYIETQIPTESFNELQESQIQWTENINYFLETVIPFNGDEAYPNVGEFKAESTKFRLLLLMLYL